MLSRLPFSLLGAIGLLSVGDTIIGLEENLGALLEIWRAAWSPVLNTVLGPIEKLFGIELDPMTRDYISMGAVVMGMDIRAYVHERQLGITDTRQLIYGPGKLLASIQILSFSILWPLSLVTFCLLFGLYILRDLGWTFIGNFWKAEHGAEISRIYFETAVIALLISIGAFLFS